jgi:hypothetical protein
MADLRRLRDDLYAFAEAYGCPLTERQASSHAACVEATVPHGAVEALRVPMLRTRALG